MAAVTLRQTRALAAAVALAACVAGCGGSKSSSANVLGSPFTAKAASLCNAALSEKRREAKFPFASFNPTKPDVSKLPAIGRYEERGVQIFRSWDRKMLALGAPPHGGKQWAALLDALNAHTRIIADQQAAAVRRDAPEFTRDYYAGNKAQSDMTKAAAAAGLAVCATAAGA